LQLGTGLGTGLAGAGGALGGVAGLIGAYSNTKEAMSNGVDNNTKITSGGNVISSLAGGASSFGSLIGNVSSQASAALSNPTVDAIKDAANQAANVSGILGIITGSIDVIKGALEMHIAGKRKDATDNELKQKLGTILSFNESIGIVSPGDIDTIVDNGDYDAIYYILNNYVKNARPEGKPDEFKFLINLTSHLSNKQSRIRTEAGLTMGKGAMAIAGGAMLVALGSNPVGWGLLGAAAVVGIGILIYKHIKKGMARKEVAIRELNIVSEQAKYEKDKTETDGWFSFWNRAEKNEKMKEKGHDELSPLDKKLKELGKKNVGEWYSEYVNLTAAKIFNEHYAVDTTENDYDKKYNNILINLGFMTKFEIDQANEGKKEKPYPSVKKIAKAIAN
jgi:hypothetical protein